MTGFSLEAAAVTSASLMASEHAQDGCAPSREGTETSGKPNRTVWVTNVLREALRGPFLLTDYDWPVPAAAPLLLPSTQPQAAEADTSSDALPPRSP